MWDIGRRVRILVADEAATIVGIRTAESPAAIRLNVRTDRGLDVIGLTVAQVAMMPRRWAVFGASGDLVAVKSHAADAMRLAAGIGGAWIEQEFIRGDWATVPTPLERVSA